MLGDLLDNRYRIMRTLSKGGFGQTYIAEDTRRPGHPHCVMKHLKPIVLDPSHFENARRLFHTEAIALERLGDHPQIPRLLAYFEENSNFFLVQDLIRGYPLSKELKPNFKWLESDIYQLLHELLSILIFVHDRGVIHRDIKPDNIIRRQPDRTLVLVDFGSVKQIRAHLPISDETGHTIPIGTMGYMATEQARGRPRPNSDLYSLGIIGIQAATGIKPRYFQEDFETGELKWRHETDISDGLANFLEKMVAYHFKERYADAREALRALKKVQLATPVRSTSLATAMATSMSSPTEQSNSNVSSSSEVVSAPSPPSVELSATSQERSNLLVPTSSLTEKRPNQYREDAPEKGALPQPTFIELPETTNTSNVGLDTDSTIPLASLPKHRESNTVTMDLSDVVHSTNAAPAIKINLDPVSKKVTPPKHDKGASINKNKYDRGTHQTLPSLADELTVVEPLVYAHHQTTSPPVKLSKSEATSPTDSTLSLAPVSLFQRLSSVMYQPVGTVGSRLWRKVRQLIQMRSRSPSLSMKTALIMGGGILLTCGVGLRGYQSVQHENTINNALYDVQSELEQEKYEACRQKAQVVREQYAELQEVATDLEGQCTLSQVNQLGEKGQVSHAIAVVNTIPTSHPYYQQARDDLGKWFLHGLAKAKEYYESGSINPALDTAIELAQNVPPNHPLQAEIQFSILKWNLEQELWLKSQNLLDDQQWQEAIKRARPLLNSPPFKNEVSGLIREAEVNIRLFEDRDNEPKPLSAEQNTPNSTVRRSTRQDVPRRSGKAKTQ